MRRLLAAIALTATAASATKAQDTFVIKEDAVKIQESAILHDSKTFIVPYATVLASANGGMWQGAGNVKLHANFFVLGIDKATMQDLSLKLHTDLVTKLRALGLTVLTYDDVKDHDAMKGADRRTPDADKRYDGMNTTKDRSSEANFVVATATDEMNIKPALQGAHWGLRGIAKDKDAVLMVPEYWFSIPIAVGKGEEGYVEDKVEVTVLPGMKLHKAFVEYINKKARGGMIQTRSNQKVSGDVGTVTKGATDDFSFGGFKRGSADFTIALDKQKFAAGVLKAGYAFNDVVVAQVKKEQASGDR